MSNENSEENLHPTIIYGESKPNTPITFLPFYKRINLPIPPEDIPFLQTIMPESCGSKIIIGSVTGYVMGLGLGVFMGAMGDVSAIQIIQGREVPQAPLREQMRAALKATMTRSTGMGKTFCVLTALFGGVECLIEKYRAKHDVWNPVLSGCAVGATLSAKGGPAAACIGCGNVFINLFVIFSL